jgi:multicomponent Na+:H+ antiporter subunit A
MTTLVGLWARTGDDEIQVVLKGWILAHALYKASLFLYAGLVQELSDTRNLSELAGIKLEGTPIRILGYSLAGASLGMPFTLAYVPKAALVLDWPFKVVLLIGLLFLGTAGLLVAILPLVRSGAKAPYPSSFRSLHYGMLLPPAILVAGSYLLPWFKPLGLPVPPWFEELSSTGPRLDLNLATTFVVMILGVGMMFSWRPSWLALSDRLSPWRGSELFQELLRSILAKASILTRRLHPGSLPMYMGWLWMMVTAGLGVLLWSLSLINVPLSWEHATASLWLPTLSFATLIGAALVLRSRQPIESVITLGLVGYVLAGVFAYLGAPDLALTQLAVENMSVIVLALAIRGMSAYAMEPKGFKRGTKIILSGVCGLVVGTAVTIASSAPSQSHLKEYFSEASLSRAFGRNVVNVILVDFRALDTLAEVTVIGLAAFMAYVLLRLAREV